MIDEKTSKKILTIGCSYNQPKGGIAQVIKSYSKLFFQFRFIKTSDPWSGVLHNMVVAIRAWIKFCWVCIFGRISIVHVHGASNNSFWRKRIFINTAKIFKKKVIYHIHGGEFDSFSLTHRREVAKVLEKVDQVIVLSSYWENFFKDNFNINKIAIIPNITELPVYKSQKAKKGVGVFLGVLDQRKGIFDILNVIKNHKNALRDNFILYVGGNGESEKVVKLIQEYGIEDIVKFEGWVGPERKSQLLSLANIYLLPSYNEGLPISILEAMSYGLAIISTNVGGIPEVVHNNENGFIINPGDRDALFNVLSLLINNSELRIKMGEVSKKLVVPHFPENVEKSLIKIYNNLLANNISDE